MSIGSLSASTLSTTSLSSSDTAAQSAKARETESPTIADHVAADGDREPVPSASTTLGTLVDTYL